MRHAIELGRVQETALVPLYARALESRRRRVVGCTLRSALFDVFVRDFLGLRLVESRTVAEVPDCLRPRLPLALRTSLWFFGRFFPRLMRLYQLCVFSGP